MPADEHNLERILASKRAYRQRLAAQPITEKLRLLEVLRERALAIRRAARPAPAVLREQSAEYQPRPSPKTQV
jgi:hypothetical protein